MNDIVEDDQNVLALRDAHLMAHLEDYGLIQNDFPMLDFTQMNGHHPKQYYYLDDREIGFLQ